VKSPTNHLRPRADSGDPRRSTTLMCTSAPFQHPFDHPGRQRPFLCGQRQRCISDGRKRPCLQDCLLEYPFPIICLTRNKRGVYYRILN
jgi:hypothetical protein